MNAQAYISDKKWDGDGVPLEESNCAGIGSDEDKALRKQAAQTEPAWEGVGEEPGLWIWRVDNFQVVPWPKEKKGKFHVKDSYIILHVSAGEEPNEPLDRQIYFWLGKKTGIDERGVAAYKTVELDDYFDGGCGQHREVMKKESDEFQAIFPNSQYLAGGVESGFNPAQPEIYMAKLFHCTKSKKDGFSATEVTLQRSSLNHRDCFILDNGTTVYVWYGDSASPFNKADTGREAQAMADERLGRAEVTYSADERFWELLGGPGEVTPADQVPDDEEEPDFGDGVLYKVWVDEERAIRVEQVGRRNLDRSMLDNSAVMLLDTRSEIFLWLGKQAPPLTKRNAMPTAIQYLKTNNRSIEDTAIHLFKDGNGMKNKVWAQTFPKGTGKNSIYASTPGIVYQPFNADDPVFQNPPEGGGNERQRCAECALQ